MPDLSPFAQSIYERTYRFDSTETWTGCARRVAHAVANDHDQEEQFFNLINERIIIPGGRYLWSSGRKKFYAQNCYGFVAGDSREEWAKLLHDVTMCLSTGGGLGVNYSHVRASGSQIATVGGIASGPIALMSMINETARNVMAGGKRRSALWAGLHWSHPDIEQFVTIKDWNEDYRAMKAKDFNYPAPLDMTNVSVIIDNDYIHKLHEDDSYVSKLHALILDHMLHSGEPGFWNLSRVQRDDPQAETCNACTESTLHHADTCNLMSIALPRIRDLNHLEEVTRIAIRFLYNGSLKATYPTEEIAQVVHKNRRLGLGIMGLHEFMLLHDHQYEWFPELQQYISTWAQVATDEAHRYAMHRGAIPIATRAIAPTGTISIIGECSSGIEPIFCRSYKRRYIDGNQHKYQYVIDPAAQRLIAQGIPVEKIEDAYTLANHIDRRLAVHIHMQRYVDQAISNTININTGTQSTDTLRTAITNALPFIKGMTLYPNGSRSGQPLVPVPFEEAVEHTGVVYEERGECLQGVCGL